MNTELIIEEILALVNSQSKEVNERDIFPVGFNSYLVLERIKASLDSLQVLVNDDVVKHDHAIGLILRNLLSDFITTGFIIRLSGSEENHYANLYSLYNTDLKKTDSLLKLYREHGFISDAQLKVYNDRYSNQRHIYKIIRDYSKDYNIQTFPTTNNIIKAFLKSELNDVWVNQIKASYGLWSVLSKYEHLGWNSYDLTREIDKKKSFERLNSVLFNTLIMAGSCFELLKEDLARIGIMDIVKKHYPPH